MGEGGCTPFSILQISHCLQSNVISTHHRPTVHVNSRLQDPQGSAQQQRQDTHDNRLVKLAPVAAIPSNSAT